MRKFKKGDLVVLSDDEKYFNSREMYKGVVIQLKEDENIGYRGTTLNGIVIESESIQRPVGYTNTAWSARAFVLKKEEEIKIGDIVELNPLTCRGTGEAFKGVTMRVFSINIDQKTFGGEVLTSEVSNKPVGSKTIAYIMTSFKIVKAVEVAKNKTDNFIIGDVVQMVNNPNYKDEFIVGIVTNDSTYPNITVIKSSTKNIPVGYHRSFNKEYLELCPAKIKLELIK